MLQKRYTMLPKLKKCCWCLPLRTGCFLLAVLSSLLCVTAIVLGAWELPNWPEPEDNFIAMSMVMFSTLSLISNVIILLGLLLKRPCFLQLTILFNSVFILCLFLVAMVLCLFSPYAKPMLEGALNIMLVVFAMCAGAVYSFYYMMVVNSTYRQMKAWIETAIPV